MSIDSISDKLPPQILVIASDAVQCTNLCNTIERSWFTVIRAENIVGAARLIAVNNPNVIVISSDHYSETSVLVTKLKEILCEKKMSPQNDIPFVFILDEKEDLEPYKKLTNLTEIIFRPFTPDELTTSIKSLLRRSSPVFQDKVLRYKDIRMDLATYRVYRENERIRLGPTEFRILQLLVQAPKTIFSRSSIIDYVWGTNTDIEPRTVDVHVNRLRTVIRKNKVEPPIIKTVRRSGYCLNLPGEID